MGGVDKNDFGAVERTRSESPIETVIGLCQAYGELQRNISRAALQVPPVRPLINYDNLPFQPGLNALELYDRFKGSNLLPDWPSPEKFRNNTESLQEPIAAAIEQMDQLVDLLGEALREIPDAVTVKDMTGEEAEVFFRVADNNFRVARALLLSREITVTTVDTLKDLINSKRKSVAALSGGTDRSELVRNLQILKEYEARSVGKRIQNVYRQQGQKSLTNFFSLEQPANIARIQYEVQSEMMTLRRALLEIQQTILDIKRGLAGARESIQVILAKLATIQNSSQTSGEYNSAG